MTLIKSQWRKTSVTIGPMLFLGLVMLIAGIGKVIAGTSAGETEFFDRLFPFYGPAMSSFISNVLPWMEVVLGVALLLRIWPRIAALISLPLLAGFISNNAYAISQGETFPECGYCFGVFEKLLGSPTPIQALSIDIAMFIAALIVIFFQKDGFFALRPWFFKRRVGGKSEQTQSS